MIRITSEYLRKGDLVMLKRYANWVMSTMVRPCVLRKTNISINVIKRKDVDTNEDAMDLKEYGAWVVYRGVFEGRKKFDMVLNAQYLNRRAKKPVVRLKKIMLDLAHELTHIKQYINNELFDYVEGKVRYKGKVYHLGHAADEAAYYNSPWEIEAYGREFGFYAMFKKKIKQEEKEKAKK